MIRIFIINYIPYLRNIGRNTRMNYFVINYYDGDKYILSPLYQFQYSKWNCCDRCLFCFIVGRGTKESQKTEKPPRAF